MKRLYCTVQCLATYDSGVDVPDDISLKDAVKHAKGHLCEMPKGPMSNGDV